MNRRHAIIATISVAFYVLFIGVCIAAVRAVQSPRAASVQANAVMVPVTNRLVSVTFTWIFPADASAKGVKLFWRTNGASFTNSLDCGTNTLATVTNIQAGPRYYFSAQAYSAVGKVSAPSPEVSWPMLFTNYVGVSVLLKSNTSDPGRVILQTIVTNPPGDMAFFETKIWQTNDAVTVVRIPGTSTLLIANTNQP